MNIENIKIIGLNGTLNFDIPFKNRLTILNGRNGTGKSLVLRIISSILNFRIEDLSDLNFNSIEVYFSGSFRIVITQYSDTRENSYKAYDKEVSFDITPETFYNSSDIRALFLTADRLNGDYKFHKLHNNIINSEDICTIRLREIFKDTVENGSTYSRYNGLCAILLIILYSQYPTGDNVALLIDNVELCLDIDTQSILIENLLKYGTFNQLIVSTHSPDIIQNYSDSLVNLNKI